MSRNESRGERGFIGSKKFLVGKKQEGEGIQEDKKIERKKKNYYYYWCSWCWGRDELLTLFLLQAVVGELCWRLIKDTKFLIKPLSERRECPALMTAEHQHLTLCPTHCLSINNHRVSILKPDSGFLSFMRQHEAWVLSPSSRSSEYAEKRDEKKESRNCRFLYIHLRFCFIFGVKTSKVWKERREELPENQERYFADTWMKRTKGRGFSFFLDPMKRQDNLIHSI